MNGVENNDSTYHHIYQTITDGSIYDAIINDHIDVNSILTYITILMVHIYSALSITSTSLYRII